MPKKIKIVYMGTPDFALPPLQALLEDDSFEVVAVVTQPDQKAGRKQLMTPPPVKILALEHSLPLLQPENIKDPEFLSLLQGLKPDFIVVVAYGKILPSSVLKVPKYGCINLHGSLLPKYRGASPVEEALLQGDIDTGVTFIQMDEGLDSGDVLVALRLHITPADDALLLRKKLSILGAAQLPYLLKDLVEGVIKPLPQNHERATYCRKITKEDGLIDLKILTATEIKNRMRAYTPWPSCFLMLNGKRVKLLEIGTTETSALKPGQTLQQEDGTIALGTKKGAILLEKIQLEGKNPLTIQEFLRGNSDFFKNTLANPK